MNKKIRSLKPNEIEIRVQQVTAKGAQLLLYKDSRCDKRILDETFGIDGWKNRYEEIKGNLFCTISIWDETKGQWIDKCDCGTESFSEKEKGEASDAFKRAGFNVGIGRKLYTRIFYFANVPTTKNEKGKYVLIDTAGRLHIDNELMDELENIVREVNPHEILLIIDAMMGQDAINVITGFNDKLSLTGVILTKLDGTAKGGVVVGIVAENQMPVKFVGVGEQIDDMEIFNSEDFVKALI